MRLKTRLDYRRRRHARQRKRMVGTAERPRMSVYFSNKHIYVQAVDDIAGHTMAAASTCGADLRAGKAAQVTTDTAARIGRETAEKLVSMGVKEAVFDRGGFRYGARMKALADAAREAGLKL